MNMQSNRMQFSDHPMTDLQPVHEQWSQNPKCTDTEKFAKLTKSTELIEKLELLYQRRFELMENT